tara:strand:+ start:3672 stop:3980 length:309 start_codon:yes stop_codon:yes gene_type:complete
MHGHPMSIPMTPIVHTGVDTLSLRQLDVLNAAPKGTTFKAFRRCESQLREGVDYFYLPADEHAELIARLKAAQQVYATTVNLLLLTRVGYARLQQLLADVAG